MFNIPKTLHELHYCLPFLLMRMEIEKVEKLVANLHDQVEYVIHIKNLKTIIETWIIFEKSS